MARPRMNVDKRMAAAVRMRKGGGSLRQIGDRLGVSKDTVANDLARYEREQVSNLLSDLLSNPALFYPPNSTAEETP
jgi:transposase